MFLKTNYWPTNITLDGKKGLFRKALSAMHTINVIINKRIEKKKLVSRLALSNANETFEFVVIDLFSKASAGVALAIQVLLSSDVLASLYTNGGSFRWSVLLTASIMNITATRVAKQS